MTWSIAGWDLFLSGLLMQISAEHRKFHSVRARTISLANQGRGAALCGEKLMFEAESRTSGGSVRVCACTRLGVCAGRSRVN